MIPIGVDADAYRLEAEQARRAVDQRFPFLEGRRRVVVLGLLHPKKGLERLAMSWGRVNKDFREWRLVIAGADAGYEAQGRAAFAIHAPGDSVLWLGPVYGKDKAELLAGSDLLVLASDWENFGIVVIEALAAGIPAITTTGSPWKELPERDCGWWVRPCVDALAEALSAAMAMEDGVLRAMGERGRQLVYEKYTWEQCGTEMTNLYEATIRRERRCA